jgi:hypothetical protein
MMANTATAAPTPIPACVPLDKPVGKGPAPGNESEGVAFVASAVTDENEFVMVLSREIEAPKAEVIRMVEVRGILPGGKLLALVVSGEERLPRLDIASGLPQFELYTASAALA